MLFEWKLFLSMGLGQGSGCGTDQDVGFQSLWDPWNGVWGHLWHISPSSSSTDNSGNLLLWIPQESHCVLCWIKYFELSKHKETALT